MRLATCAVLALLAACGRDDAPAPVQPPPPPPDPTAAAREAMVKTTIEARGIHDPRVVAAIRRVHREELVPQELRARAYEDSALPIGFDQTISQPYIVAAMSEAAHIVPGARVLEIGTGSGYQSAVLLEMGADVYTIEIVEPLAKRTHAALARLGYTGARLHVRIGDGYRGWPEAAPFDAIIVTAAPPQVPRPLVEQLAPGGRLVIPVGDHDQRLDVIRKGLGETTTETLMDVRFVPMTGEAQRGKDAAP